MGYAYGVKIRVVCIALLVLAVGLLFMWSVRQSLLLQILILGVSVFGGCALANVTEDQSSKLAERVMNLAMGFG